MKRFFKIDITWFEDLSDEAAVIYGYLLNAVSICKIIRADENGEVYYRFSNSFIEKQFGLSDFKIKEILKELEECQYISILKIRKPNSQKRYIKFNVLKTNIIFDAFYDLFDPTDRECIPHGLILSYVARDINMYNSNTFELIKMNEFFGGDWGESKTIRSVLFLLNNAKLIDELHQYNDNAKTFADSYQFDWIKKDC